MLFISCDDDTLLLPPNLFLGLQRAHYTHLQKQAKKIS